MIVASGLTRSFGDIVAVEDVSFEVRPGALVGLVGHEGAGKTTTVGMLVGLVTPTAGRAEILGRPYAEHPHPLRTIGVALRSGLPPRRTIRQHLDICAALAGLEPGRTDAALRVVGLGREADRRSRAVPAGVHRRVAIAVALLADPEVLILDEPGDGLDPRGAEWLRGLLRGLADGGRAVLVTGREFDRVEEVADRLLVLDRGRLLSASAPDELAGAEVEILVRSPGAEVLVEELRAAGIEPVASSSEELRVRDVPPRLVSDIASAADLPVWEIREEEPSLETVVDVLAVTGSSGSDEPAGPADEDPPIRSHDADEVRLDDALAALTAPKPPKVIAVVAPGSGTGATTMAFLAADALAANGGIETLAVALSCDHERMSLPVAAEHRTSLGLGDLLGDLPDFDDGAHIAPYVSVAASGAHVLCGPPEADELWAIEPAQIETLLGFARRFYGLLVLDVGELSGPALRRVVRGADRVLLLRTPGAADAGLDRGDVLRAIETERSDEPVVVANRVGSEGMGVPLDHGLIRALDAGDFELGDALPATRVGVKTMALAAVEGLW